MVQVHFWITICLLLGIVAIFGWFVKVFLKEKKKGFFGWYSLILAMVACSFGAGSIWLSHEQVKAVHRFCEVGDKIIELHKELQ